MFKIRTREPGPVLGNLDLNRTLVGDPYLGTRTRTWEPGSVLTCTRFCTHGPISVTHTVLIEKYSFFSNLYSRNSNENIQLVFEMSFELPF